jgi:hypothetical protein
MSNRLAPFSEAIGLNKSQCVLCKEGASKIIFYIVQKMAKCLHKKKMPHFLLKFDISKAFD